MTSICIINIGKCVGPLWSTNRYSSPGRSSFNATTAFYENVIHPKYVISNLMIIFHDFEFFNFINVVLPLTEVVLVQAEPLVFAFWLLFYLCILRLGCRVDSFLGVRLAIDLQNLCMINVISWVVQFEYLKNNR